MATKTGRTLVIYLYPGKIERVIVPDTPEPVQTKEPQPAHPPTTAKPAHPRVNGK